MAQNGGAFAAGHRLTRVDSGLFAGSVFYLEPETALEVRVTLTDPDGVISGVLTASGSTRSLVPPIAAGDTWHVSTDGDDDTYNGSEQSPFLTIGRAVTEAQPGDQVIIHAGTYREEIDLPRSGQAAAPIVIRGAGDGEVVLDGSDPDLLDGHGASGDLAQYNCIPHVDLSIVHPT